MVLDTGSSPIDKMLLRRLFSANLVVFVVVLFVFSLCVFGFAYREATRELRDTMSLFCGSLISSIDPGELEPDLLNATRSEPTSIPLNEMQVEWYSPQGKLLYKLGALKLKLPFDKDAHFEKQSEPPALCLTRPAVLRGKLMGYVRVAQSLDDFDRECARLLGGLAVGILGSSIVSAVGIFWLTQQSLKSTEEAFLRLKRFTDDASHEFGTPLMAMKSNLALVLKRSPSLSDEDRERLGIVDTAIDDMKELANGLLLLARSDVEQERDYGQILDLSDLAEKSVRTFSAFAEEKKISLSAQCSPGLFVKGNVTDLERMIDNVGKNAIQYTPEHGAVTLKVSRVGDKIELKVEDTGIGIAPGDLPKLFDRFWRGDRARTYRFGGTGLDRRLLKASLRSMVAKLLSPVKSTRAVVLSSNCPRVIRPLMRSLISANQRRLFSWRSTPMQNWCGLSRTFPCSN